MAGIAPWWRFAMLVASGAAMQAAGPRRDADINSLLQLVVEDVARNASSASEVVLGAERRGKEIMEVASRCHRKYGRGAFVAHYTSLEDVRANRCLPIDSWIESAVRKSSTYPLPKDGPIPPRVLDAARAFSCECPDGDLGRKVIYRRAEKLIEQLPPVGATESRVALETYDPACEICVCGEVAAGDEDDIFTVAARLPIEAFTEKQEEQRKKWGNVREYVMRLKSLGNEEMQDREVGTDLAAKSYREGLRVLLESEMEDFALECTLRSNLAEALARQGVWSESVEESTRALELEPDNTKALFRRGRALLRVGRVEEARGDLVRAARASPQDRAIREELEAARRYVPPPRAAPASAGSPGKADVRVVPRQRRIASMFWRHLRTFAPQLWRQMVFWAALALAVSLFERWRRRWSRK